MCKLMGRTHYGRIGKGAQVSFCRQVQALLMGRRFMESTQAEYDQHHLCLSTRRCHGFTQVPTCCRSAPAP